MTTPTFIASRLQVIKKVQALSQILSGNVEVCCSITYRFLFYRSTESKIYFIIHTHTCTHILKGLKVHILYFLCPYAAEREGMQGEAKCVLKGVEIPEEKNSGFNR